MIAGIIEMAGQVSDVLFGLRVDISLCVQCYTKQYGRHKMNASKEDVVTHIDHNILCARASAQAGEKSQCRKRLAKAHARNRLIHSV